MVCGCDHSDDVAFFAFFELNGSVEGVEDPLCLYPLCRPLGAALCILSILEFNVVCELVLHMWHSVEVSALGPVCESRAQNVLDSWIVLRPRGYQALPAVIRL